MITGPVSNEELNCWQEIHRQFKDKLKPNRKSGAELLAFLKDKYPLKETFDEKYLLVVTENVLENEFLSEKLPDGEEPAPVGFFLLNEGLGASVYSQQEEIWENFPIFIGIDLSSGYFHVEGSCYLHDELFAFQGIDEYDLKNYVLTATYIECIKKFYPEHYELLILEK